MLTIAAVLAEYGLTPGDVARFAKEAVGFGEAYASTKNYVLFTSSYRQAFPSATREAADLAYRVGKYWFQQGAALSQIDPNQAIPRGFARVSDKATDTLGIFSPYNYTVRTSFTDPRTETVKHYSTIVTSETPLSLNEAYAQAYVIALDIIKHYDPFAVEADWYEDLIPSQSLEAFTRYE